MTIPNLSVKSWLIAGAAVLLGIVVLLAKLGPSKSASTQASAMDQSIPDTSKGIGSTDQAIDEMEQTIEKAKQDAAAKNSTHAEPPPLPNPMQAQNQMQAEQMRQMLAQRAFMQAMNAGNRRQEGYQTEGKKQFVIRRSESHETPVTPERIVSAQPEAPSKAATGGFACGSEEDYWSACIPEGSVIQTVTTNELRGDFTGPVITKVSQSFISNDKKNVLIPKGTIVLGESGKVGSQEQARLAIVFHRAILSEGSAFHHAGWSVNLDKLQGLSVDGSAGQEGHVNHHWGSTIAASAAYGLLAGFALSGTGSVLTNDGIGVYRQGISQAAGQQGQQTLSRLMNRIPTINVPTGSECNVYIASDLRMR